LDNPLQLSGLLNNLVANGETGTVTVTIT